MDQEKMFEQILQAIRDNRTVIDFIKDNGATKEDISKLDAKIDGVEQRLDAKIDGVEQRLDAKIDGVEQRLDAKIDGVEQRLDAKIDGVEQRLSGEIREVRDEMIDHVDGFVGLYKKHEVELAAVVHRQDRFEERLQMVIKHLGLESV